MASDLRARMPSSAENFHDSDEGKFTALIIQETRLPTKMTEIQEPKTPPWMTSEDFRSSEHSQRPRPWDSNRRPYDFSAYEGDDDTQPETQPDFEPSGETGTQIVAGKAPL